MVLIQLDVVALLEEFVLGALDSVLGSLGVARELEAVLQPPVVLSIAGHAELAIGVVVNALQPDVDISDRIDSSSLAVDSRPCQAVSLLGHLASLLRRRSPMVPVKDGLQLVQVVLNHQFLVCQILLLLIIAVRLVRHHGLDHEVGPAWPLRKIIRPLVHDRAL